MVLVEDGGRLSAQLAEGADRQQHGFWSLAPVAVAVVSLPVRHVAALGK